MWHSLWYNNRLSCFVLQIGTYQMALCSKAHNKPFYVVAESFKFVRLYPLNQQDVPDKFKVKLYRFFFLPPPLILYSEAFLTYLFWGSTVQSRHLEDCKEPVRRTSNYWLHTSLPHHPPLHWPGSPYPICSQRWTHQTLFITASQFSNKNYQQKRNVCQRFNSTPVDTSE